MLCAVLCTRQILKYFLIAYLVYFVCHDLHLSGNDKNAFLSLKTSPGVKSNDFARNWFVMREKQLCFIFF